MPLPLTPQPPIPTFRGDNYRLNFTAGVILALLAENPAGLSTRGIVDTLSAENLAAGIPGGPAGQQWTPPGKRPTKPGTGSGPDDDDDADGDGAEPADTYPDTLREHCTYFEQAEDRVAAVLRMLDYCHLIEYTGLGAEIRPLGSDVLTLMEGAEQHARSTAASSTTLTPVQNYLAGDPRAAATAYLPTRPTLPLSITEAVRIAAAHYTPENTDITGTFAALPPDTYTPAVVAANQHPGMTIDIGTGDPHLDTELPIRRNMHRRPSYRQFLWIILNDKNTFVLAQLGVSEETVRLVATKAVTGSAEELRANPTLAALKAARTLARKIRPFAQAVLSGGPEAVWAGKPLNPKDVHVDVTSFIAASRPGFTPQISRGSSLAWEAYNSIFLSLMDYEAAREALRDGYGNGLVSRELVPTPEGTDPRALAAAAKADTDTRRFTIDTAGDYIARTSDKVLEEIGIDVEVRPVMTPSGVPMDLRCQYQNVHINSETGHRTAFRCRGQSIGGSGYCERHGGTYLTADETASLVRASQQKLFAGASRATEVMIELMLNSSNDAIRLRAAEQILNRSGLSESRDINLNVSEQGAEKSAAQSVREKIKALAGLPPEVQREIAEQRDNGAITEYGEVIDVETEPVE